MLRPRDSFSSAPASTLLTFNHIPSVLVEVGFISNEEDSAFIESEDGASKISEAIANGIIAYVNEK